MLFNKRFFSIIILAVFLGVTSCSHIKTNVSKTYTPEESFLKYYNLKVKNSPTKFNVNVPQSWDVQLGAYPEGLYWDLANVFSKDAGLDLTSIKGKTVEAQIYELEDGLPGSGDSARFQYPSNAILLVKDGQVAGAWLALNIASIGPSVTKKTLQDLTGLTFEQWVDRQPYFSDAGSNSNLEGLSPTEVVDTFFSAINKGDKSRAVACLSPQTLRESLTVNLVPGHLYHQGFNQDNSIVENLAEGNPASYELYDPERPVNKLKEIGNRKQIGVEVKLKNIKWLDPSVDNPEGNTTRFARLTKYKNGWKLDGLGTGP